jgi:fatty-acyl-CoA synthase
MPGTGVGKVFKPQLRWNAAKRVFTKTLAPLIEQGIVNLDNRDVQFVL